MHCATSTISATEQTIIQATDTLTALDRTVPSSTSEYIVQAKAIQKLQNILMPTLLQNVSLPPTTGTQSPRVLHPRLPATPEEGCTQQAHHQGCYEPLHVIILYRPCLIQLRLPPLQMIPQRRPTYDWCNPSIKDTHKVTTHLPSWKIACRTMKMMSLQTT